MQNDELSSTATLHSAFIILHSFISFLGEQAKHVIPSRPERSEGGEGPQVVPVWGLV
jgi:hypothetical protein